MRETVIEHFLRTTAALDTRLKLTIKEVESEKISANR